MSAPEVPVIFADATSVMRRAVELAWRGEGFVEPNPMVGAVLVDDSLRLLGEGWHQRFGGPHAEVYALAQAGERARGGTLFVTLEPCCHQGKTSACVDAVIAAGVRRVVVAMEDPFPQVAGGGLRKLREAGIEVEVGLLAAEARRLTAPFRTLIERVRPYVHAKWAMTLDGRIASATGESKWISNAKSREAAHRLRGRMDAVVVGIGTVLADDPLLTARPAGPRTATRVVFDHWARLPLTSQLVRTIEAAPLVVVCSPQAPDERKTALRSAGVELLPLQLPETFDNLTGALAHFGMRKWTNVLIEGGGRLLGEFFDQNLIDELHVFVSPKLLGGREARSPIEGRGLPRPPDVPQFPETRVEPLDGDLYIRAWKPE